MPTTLFDAIKGGDFAAVKALIEADPSQVNAADERGLSAVLAAVYHQRRDIVNLLVSRGATLTIFDAAAAGEIEQVERQLEADPRVLGAVSGDGWTPLHLAAHFGHDRIVELLLASGADIAARSRNGNGNTALHAALAGNRTLVAGLLVGHGADVNAPDAAGWRPLHLAAANGNLDAVKMLVAQGADVGATTGEGIAPSALARQRGHREVAAFLARYGG